MLSVTACRCALAASALGIVNNSTRSTLISLIVSTLISLIVSVDVKHHFFLLFFFLFLSVRLIQRTLEGVVFGQFSHLRVSFCLLFLS